MWVMWWRGFSVVDIFDSAVAFDDTGLCSVGSASCPASRSKTSELISSSNCRLLVLFLLQPRVQESDRSIFGRCCSWTCLRRVWSCARCICTASEPRIRCRCTLFSLKTRFCRECELCGLHIPLSLALLLLQPRWRTTSRSSARQQLALELQLVLRCCFAATLTVSTVDGPLTPLWEERRRPKPTSLQ